MKAFMDQDFLLKTETAKTLYHEYADGLPIIDYHCHINPMEIYEDRHYETITQAWLEGDHYKWRAMRSCGVPERYVTGEAAPEEKFQQWAQILPGLLGNPLYHWTHLELQRYFGIDEPLNGKNAMEIYRACNERLAGPQLSVRGIIRSSRVRLICTTDDPADDLKAHELLAADPSAPAVVLPALRPDRAMQANKADFPAYVAKLEQAVGYSIETMEDMRRALADRIDYFAKRGCTVSDHGLDFCFWEEAGERELDEIFARAKAGAPISERERLAYHTALLRFAAGEYSRRGWVMQLHFGCLRNNSAKMFARLGADTGFDSINDAANAQGLSRLLSALEREEALPQTILYSLNPSDNAMIGSLIGCFQSDSPLPGRVQQGSAWWFNDHRQGMEEQLKSLMSLGAIATFNGMLTDSRSFLSYTRHEYFRRILCNLLGQMAEDGEYPADLEALGELARKISYDNAREYFGFGKYLN